MGIQFSYLAIKIPQAITTSIVSLLLTALSHMLPLFKSPQDPDDDDTSSSSSDNYILILNGSLHPVPLHVITTSIKNKVPIIPYSEFIHRGQEENALCTVCLECINDKSLIRELVNCKHVFHLECLDRWVDVGQVNCPLCRSMLLSPKLLLSRSISTGVDPVM